ncbi:MAG: cytidylate kinase family protein [Deltaproteobacteria bacterium]|nr:cytidylate kinase family protein [Deltaproteobacteria bacterium]
MPVISITAGDYAGGEEIALRVSDALKMKSINREILLETARTFNLPEAMVSHVFERTPSFWERMTESRRTYLAYIQATLADCAKNDDLLYCGNAGQELLSQVPHVLRILVLCPMERRAASLARAENLTADTAAGILTRQDEERAKRLRHLFDSDWMDPALYDLVLNLEKVPLDAAVEMILQAVRLPEFQLSPQKQGAFQDFLIKTRVVALLAGLLVGRLSLIRVEVADGVVGLTGSLTKHEEAVNQAVHQIETMEGVKKVQNDIVMGVVYHEYHG